MQFSVLSWDNPEANLVLGDMVLCYRLDPASGVVAFSFFPRSKVGDLVARRTMLPDAAVAQLPRDWPPITATSPESLVQLHVRGFSLTAGFAQGRTLRNGESCSHARLEEQRVVESGEGVVITTRLRGSRFFVDHVVDHRSGEPGFRTWTVFHNAWADPFTLEMLSSFSVSGVTPFASDDAPERLRAHRLRSAWSAEGRLESRFLEELHLERSWSGHAQLSERFGQVGSMPVRGFFPFAALEDTVAGVCWGAHLELASSWQLELYRRNDDACFSGGLADRELGHWWKTVMPGDQFTSPVAALSCVVGDVDDLCSRLTSLQARAAGAAPSVERSLPIVFNDWCSAWGTPSEESVLALAQRLAGTPTRYLVIDAGWATPRESPDQWSQNGDWRVNPDRFPRGLGPVCEKIRSLGLIPGLWFEFEICTEGSEAWLQSDHHLHRDGAVLQVGTRRFWDFRDPYTTEHLTKKVIALLRDNGFGYLKVDYNDTIGLGVDGSDSPGEGLRQHICGVQEFFREIRRQLPDLVIENCSSGGHRLEPSMMALCSMASFSDAHETPEIPIIAANLHRVILPRQSQIWAVLRATDSVQRLQYSLAATFLGRMALSGDLVPLAKEQWLVVEAAQDFYGLAAPIIAAGTSRLFGVLGTSYRHPKGWQAVRRVSEDGTRLLLVVHTFEQPPSGLSIPMLQVPGRWKVSATFGSSFALTRGREAITIEGMGAFAALALVLENDPL